MSKWIGAHVSAAGGVQNTPLRAQEIEASALALFTKNQLQWSAEPYSDETVRAFGRNLRGAGLSPGQVLPHASYLINLGAPNRDTREKSFRTFLDELRRVERLGLGFLNFHPGSSKGEISQEESIAHIVDAMNRAMRESDGAMLVLETTAGQGSTIGSTFEELAAIMDGLTDTRRVGICVDTCHVFAAGYDISTTDGWEGMLERLEQSIGLSYLVGFHLNDTQSELGSRRDRHESIGSGRLGTETFRRIMQDARTDELPLILETPEPERWAEEIAMLRAFASSPTEFGAPPG